MGMITITTRGSFGARSETFSAEKTGHAHTVAQAIAWLAQDTMTRAIQNDHECHCDGVEPGQGFAGKPVLKKPPVSGTCRPFYITFGQVHVHSIAGKTLDKDCVAVIKAADEEEARRLAFEMTDGRFCHLKREVPDLSYFPRGLVYLNCEVSDFDR